MNRIERLAALKQSAKERILILDGSWGVMIQRRGLDEADFLGERFKGHKGQMKGNNDILCLTRPDIIADLHNQYYAAGADISETNTFSATTIAQDDYHMADLAREMNLESARLARAACDKYSTPGHQRYVAGALGLVRMNFDSPITFILFISSVIVVSAATHRFIELPGQKWLLELGPRRALASSS